MFALYGAPEGRQSNNAARFNWFEFKGNDDVYK
jgi:hypothetical protein